MKKSILLFLILISSCNENKKTQKTESKEDAASEFKLSKSDFVILTYQSEWHWAFQNVKPSELNQAELVEIENILKIAIKENNEIQKKELIKHNKANPNYQLTKTGYELQLGEFKRQYVPIINNKEQKEVFINFFCDDSDEEYWRTELILVEDGGNCYYNLKVNLTTKEYSLEINYDA